eukprot:5277380-Amphidinium_carterae.1
MLLRTLCSVHVWSTITSSRRRLMYDAVVVYMSDIIKYKSVHSRTNVARVAALCSATVCRNSGLAKCGIISSTWAACKVSSKNRKSDVFKHQHHNLDSSKTTRTPEICNLNTMVFSKLRCNSKATSYAHRPSPNNVRPNSTHAHAPVAEIPCRAYGQLRPRPSKVTIVSTTSPDSPIPTNHIGVIVGQRVKGAVKTCYALLWGITSQGNE